jgi:hypothetical protein
MNCPNEFIESQYIDGELPERERAEFSLHLEICSVCRERVAVLETEKQLLLASLQGIDCGELENPVAQRDFPDVRKVGWFTAGFSIATVLLRMIFDLVFGTATPAVLDWASPFSPSGFLSWLGNGIFYFMEKGAPMITSFMEKSAITMMALMAVGAMILLLRKMKTITTIFCFVSAMFVFVMPGYSMEYRHAGKWGNIVIPPEETVNDTLVVWGDAVKIRGTIRGDLIIMARKADIQGAVEGNVFCAAQTIDMTGRIEGDACAAGQFVQANGSIGANFWGAGLNLMRLGSGAKIQNNAAIFSSDLSIDGEIGRDLAAVGGMLDIDGIIGRDLLFSGGQIMVQAPAKIGRNLYAQVTSKEKSGIGSGAAIGGEKIIKLVETRSRYSYFRFYLVWFFYLIAAFLLGLLLFGIMPKARRFSFSNIRMLAASGGIGILVFIALPVAALILAIPLFSLPIGILIFAIWFVGLFMAPVTVANYIGCAMLRREDSKPSTRALALLIGLFLVVVAVNLPYVGTVINLLLIFIGLGALAISFYQTWVSRRQTAEI